ncbi:hypothetical protein [Gluconobacter wancherniae]|uniref:hypothetical protein n=1 Tax=Gluconobacter wancherniae TaxID=1307955 RepID=UPI001B8C8675|nr:hypothetical protein [Gluconobacter wancherniae]MBS1089917.1 hypothetical protein [Gluconobacter wancherniae]
MVDDTVCADQIDEQGAPAKYGRSLQDLHAVTLKWKNRDLGFIFLINEFERIEEHVDTRCDFSDSTTHIPVRKSKKRRESRSFFINIPELITGFSWIPTVIPPPADDQDAQTRMITLNTRSRTCRNIHAVPTRSPQAHTAGSPIS